RVLRDALERGALDDGALAELAAAIAGHPAAARVTQVQTALADFEFDLAQLQLDAVLGAVCSLSDDDAEAQYVDSQETME
ncbi:MAG: hypothetical protein ABWY02_05795, partial [Telluria sp.]